MRRAVTLLIFVLVFPGLYFGAGAFSGEAFAKRKKVTEEYYDIVIFGVDRRSYERTGRSDVMLIVHCEPNKITFFSIPRDTLTWVRGRLDKINHAFAYGKVRLAKSTLESFLKFKIDNYVAVDFDTFLNTVEIIKKLTDNGKLIGAENFLASGENLLKWLRFRGYKKGDRRRCQRHQLFMKRIFEYTQDMYLDQPLPFGQCMKAGLKVVDTDLTYEHAAQLYETYKKIDVENDIERFVLPGYGSSRYRNNNGISRKRYESSHMPNFNAIVQAEGLEGEEAAKRKKKLIKQWRRRHPLVNYYIPRYRYSLVEYVKWFRKHNVQVNYKEVDTLRK